MECVSEAVHFEGDTVSGYFVVIDHDIFWNSDHPGIEFTVSFPLIRFCVVLLLKIHELEFGYEKSLIAIVLELFLIERVLKKCFEFQRRFSLTFFGCNMSLDLICR